LAYCFNIVTHQNTKNAKDNIAAKILFRRRFGKALLGEHLGFPDITVKGNNLVWQRK
jgi:hypothetical protein